MDDLDKANPTPSVLAQLFTAIDVREQAGERAVIFTTNRKPSELAEILGDVLMSRLTGMCNGGAMMLPFPGPIGASRCMSIRSRARRSTQATSTRRGRPTGIGDGPRAAAEADPPAAGAELAGGDEARADR
jgi:hypothetical protein